MVKSNTDLNPSNKSIWFRCPYADKCGGCQLIKYPYQVQLRKKQEWVTSLLSPFGPVDPIIGMDNPMHYRNKVHGVISADKSGNPVAGVYAQGTHHVVPVKHCLIENEKADTIIQSVLTILHSFSWRIYNEYTHRGLIRHIVVRVSDTTGQIMVTLVVTSLEFPGQDKFAEQLLALHPEITTIVLNLNSRQTSAVLGNQEKVLYGNGYIEDILLNKRFRISSRSFYQVNGRQTAVLYQKAIEMCCLSGNETLLDAYCGTGTIGICASDHVKRLIGVEVNKSAIEDAKMNALANHIENASFFTDDAGRFMKRLTLQKTIPDIVLMDPPRAGSSPDFLSALSSLKPKKIIYISCNPETLARDLSYLSLHGYDLTKATPIDMFPCTQHVETVVCLSNKNARSKDYVEIGLDVEDYYRIKDSAGADKCGGAEEDE